VDVEAARPLGEPFPIGARVRHFFTTSFAVFSASKTGSVASRFGQDVKQLVWADRKGNEVGTISIPSDYDYFSARLSPDDRSLLAARRRAGLGTLDIWLMNFDRPNEQRLTSNSGNEWSPVWIDDGRAILFAGDSLGSAAHLFRKDLATSKEEQVLPPGNRQLAMDVFPDGRVIYVERAAGGFRMFQLPLARGASPAQLQLGQLSTTEMRLSPDFRAMTFVSGVGEGRMDLYVSTLPVTSVPFPVAVGVLSPARWSRDGSRIYYVRPDLTMMTRTVRTVPALTVGAPEPLFKLPRKAYLQDVSRDGRFVLLVPQAGEGQHPMAIWTDAIASTRR
jgi:hypothetical protein